MNNVIHSEVKIRMANQNDIEGLVSNRMDFIYSLKGIKAPKIFEDRTKDYLAAHLDGNTFAAWVVEVDEKIVAACMLCITQQIPTPICANGRMGYIYNVFTIDEYRKRGIASNLIKNVQAYAIEHEILILNLATSEAGYSVYEKLGFLPQNHDMAWSVTACPVSH